MGERLQGMQKGGKEAGSRCQRRTEGGGRGASCGASRLKGHSALLSVWQEVTGRQEVAGGGVCWAY